MKGLKLSSLSGEIHKVDTEHDSRPATSIGDLSKKFGEWSTRLLQSYGSKNSLLDEYQMLPLEAFSSFSLDEFCKLDYSSRFMMSSSVKDFFERNVRHEIVRKIYKSILVYYKRRHVMTIGFSFIHNHRILIQQVQSAQRAGNRYLFKLPSNRLEFVIELFRTNFPSYGVYLIDGNSLVDKTLRDYGGQLTQALENIRKYKMASGEFSERLLKTCEKERALLEQKIEHLEADRDRLVAFYSETGRFKFGRGVHTTLRLVHREIVERRKFFKRGVTRERDQCDAVMA